MGRQHKSLKKKKVPLFRCKYGHARCKGGKPCEDAMKYTGRPSDWRPEINEMLLDFFRSPPIDERVKTVTTKFDAETGKKIFEKIEKVPSAQSVPFFSAFERKMGLSHGSLSRWVLLASKPLPEPKEGEEPPMPVYPGFVDAYNQAKELQKEFLIQLGMSGLAPSAAYCFTAKNLTDMRDQKEIGGLGGGPIQYSWADEVDDEESEA